jgi:hypothetical protein
MSKKTKKNKKYREENEFKFNGCPIEFLIELKELADKGYFYLGDDYKFYQDKVVYTYYDEYFCKEYANFTANNIIFAMCPSEDKKTFSITMGNGCVNICSIEVNDENREHLFEFWRKWKRFKDFHYELYKDEYCTSKKEDEIGGKEFISDKWSKRFSMLKG